MLTRYGSDKIASDLLKKKRKKILISIFNGKRKTA